MKKYQESDRITPDRIRNQLIRICIILFAPLLIVLSASIQLVASTDPTRVLDKNEIRATAREFAEVMSSRYIHPAEGDRISALIRKNISSGAYDRLKNGRELAEHLQKDARSINGDRHITIRYSPGYIQSMKEPDSRRASEKSARLRSRLSNHGFQEIRILSGNIGYLKMNSFNGSREAFETVAAAMGFLAHCDSVIIDLRWNPGGDSRMVQVISSYFLGNEPKILDEFHYREKGRLKQIWSLPFVPGPTLEDKNLYILTSGLTFSAAEGLAYDLQALKRATIVGETTMGGGHAVDQVIVRDKFLVYVPYAVSINPVTGKNFQGAGVEPDVKSDREQALNVAHIHALKKRISLETDPAVKSELQWALDGLSLHPIQLIPSMRRLYTGSYGPVKITLERGRLYYHFGPGKLRMAPINDDYFLLENFDAFRIKIVKSNGTVTGIRVFNKSGGKSDFPKTGN
jgi:hypothetical protein